MKTTWEEKDIICGCIVHGGANADFSPPSGNTAKWTYKIGFDASRDKDNIAFVAMTDGMITGYFTKKEAAKWLNKHEMKPMTHNRFIEVMNFLRDCYLP